MRKALSSLLLCQHRLLKSNCWLAMYTRPAINFFVYHNWWECPSLSLLCDCSSSRVFPRAVWWEAHSSAGENEEDEIQSFRISFVIEALWLRLDFNFQIAFAHKSLANLFPLALKFAFLMKSCLCTMKLNLDDVFLCERLHRFAFDFDELLLCRNEILSRHFSGLDTKESIYGSRFQVPSKSFEHHRSVAIMHSKSNVWRLLRGTLHRPWTSIGRPFQQEF